MATLTYDHMGLSVADLDEARDFYARAFGFTYELDFEAAPNLIRGLVLVHPSGIRLELFEHADSQPGIHDVLPLEAVATRGYGHFAFCAPDIDTLFAAALEAGASTVREPNQTWNPSVRNAFVSDPEGNLVELIERT